MTCPHLRKLDKLVYYVQNNKLLRISNSTTSFTDGVIASQLDLQRALVIKD